MLIDRERPGRRGCPRRGKRKRLTGLEGLVNHVKGVNAGVRSPDGCAVMGVLAIRRGDRVAHRIWMIRFAGSMWGAFWLFRVMLFVMGPLLRDFEAANLLLCIWLSAPLGILIAEVVRRKLLDKRSNDRGISLNAGRVAANA